MIMGGSSNEREISLISGRCAARALSELGYQVSEIDFRSELFWLLEQLAPRPEVVFNALHGTGGEDGQIQSVFEWLGLAYTHSGVLASALGMNKHLTKQLLRAVGVNSPRARVMSLAELRCEHPLPLPYVCKPVAEGGSGGVILVTGDELSQLDEPDELLVMAEEYIPGRELTVAVIDQQALAVTEIEFEGAIFDHQAKYQPSSARHILPAPIPSRIYQQAMFTAVLAHQTLGCCGVTRSDFRYHDRSDGELFFLEINTQPGLTPLSLVPEQVEWIGCSYHALIEWLVDEALGRQRKFGPQR